MKSDFNVIIVGGGVIGAASALVLSKIGINVTIIESQSELTLTSPKLDRRNIALSYGSILFLNELGIWDSLSNFSCPIKDIVVSQKSSFLKTFLKSENYKIPAFGYTVSLQMLKKNLWTKILESKNIKPLFQTKVSDIKNNSIITENEKIDYDLCIASDGNNSSLKKICNIDSETFDYNQTAIIGTIFHERHNNYFAFERFIKDQTLAILPLHDYIYLKHNLSSFVLITNKDDEREYLDLDAQAFINKLQDNFGYRLGKFLNIKNKQKFELSASVNKQLYDSEKNVIFLGNSANSLHPVMAQGLNLGLRDVHTLQSLLKSHLKTNQRIQDAQFFSEYANLRKNDHQNIISTTHFLGNNKIPFFPKNLGILFFNELGFIQKNIVKKALGFDLYANAR